LPNVLTIPQIRAECQPRPLDRARDEGAVARDRAARPADPRLHPVVIVLDGCEDVEIHGGVVSAGIEKALWSTPTCKGIRTYGPGWGHAAKMGKVFNQGS
jgi:hypothetical protein